MLVIGGALVAIVLAKRRAARLQDEEDMTYFEKYTGENGNGSGAGGGADRASSPTNMSFSAGVHEDDLNDLPVTAHAATDAYPDRAMHYGLPAFDGFAPAAAAAPHEASYGQAAAHDAYGQAAAHDAYGQAATHDAYGQAAHAPAEYAGLDFPPNAQMGYDPSQYGGYVGGYGAGYEDQQYVMPQQALEGQYVQQQQYAYGAQGLQQQQQLTAQPPVDRVRSPSSPHPYADPSNMGRAAGAPPVQQYYGQHDEVVYEGEAR